MGPVKLNYADPETDDPDAIPVSAVIAAALVVFPLVWLVVSLLWRG